ncbi:MAG: hypothetical protein KC535_01135 [Nanoarchaeota archaeon]|nr:hypothetical protein [Nanoarchaeota archaeon]
MKLPQVLLVLILVGVLASKLYVVTLTPNPAYDSYYGMRQVDSILDTGTPLIHDDLSYQGRTTFSNPLTYYVLAFFSLFIPSVALFKFGGILLSLVVLYLIYHTSMKLYAKPWLSVFLVAVAALNPTVFNTHLNTIIPSSLFLILFLLILDSFIQQKYTSFVTLTVLATLTSSLSLVLVLGFLFYFILLKLEALKVKKTEFELLFFSAVFIIWYNLISYKKLFFALGSQSIWQNIPFELQSTLFAGISISAALTFIGIVPLVLGIYGIYSSLFEKRNRKVLFIISFALSFGLLTWLGFLQLTEGLLYIIISFILVSGHSLLQIQSFFDKTIAPWMTHALFALVIILSLVSFTTIFIYKDATVLDAPSADEVEMMNMIPNFVPEGETVIAHIKQGHMISEIANRKNFYDEHFVLAPRSQQRYEDARAVFLSQSQTHVLSILHNYGVRYVLVSDLTRKEYPTTTSLFAASDCFDEIYATATTKLYKVQCILRT